MLEAALFDLDGTLLDTAPDLAHAANAMRVEFGMPLLREDVIASFLGKGMDNLVRRVLAGSLRPEELPDYPPFDLALASFRRNYHAVNGDRAVIFDGVLEGLQALRVENIRLGVVTNKPTEFTLPLLEQTGLRGFFSTVVCGDTCEHKKPHPQPVLHACAQLDVAPGQAVLVGDSINDSLAARAAGTAILVVPYGYNEGRDIHSLDVDAIAPTFQAAVEWILARAGR